MSENEFAIRVDAGFVHDDLIPQMWSKLDERCTTVLASCEMKGTPNEHFHIMVQSKWSQKTIRNELKKYIDSSGNKCYSISNANNKSNTFEKGLYYTCKGESNAEPPLIVYNKGYTSKLIEFYHKTYWAKNNALKKESQNKGKPYFVQIFHRVKDDEFVKATLTHSISTHKFGKRSFQSYLRKMVIKSYITDVKTFPNKFQIENIAGSLMTKLLVHYGYLLDDIAEIFESLTFEDLTPDKVYYSLSSDMKKLII